MFCSSWVLRKLDKAQWLNNNIYTHKNTYTHKIVINMSKIFLNISKRSNEKF